MTNENLISAAECLKTGFGSPLAEFFALPKAVSEILTANEGKEIAVSLVGGRPFILKKFNNGFLEFITVEAYNLRQADAKLKQTVAKLPVLSINGIQFNMFVKGIQSNTFNATVTKDGQYFRLVIGETPIATTSISLSDYAVEDYDQYKLDCIEAKETPLSKAKFTAELNALATK